MQYEYKRVVRWWFLVLPVSPERCSDWGRCERLLQIAPEKLSSEEEEKPGAAATQPGGNWQPQWCCAHTHIAHTRAEPITEGGLSRIPTSKEEARHTVCMCQMSSYTERYQRYRSLSSKRPWTLEIHEPKKGGGSLHGEVICMHSTYTREPYDHQ